MSIFYKVGAEKKDFFIIILRVYMIYGINGKYRKLFGKHNLPILSFHTHK